MCLYISIIISNLIDVPIKLGNLYFYLKFECIYVYIIWLLNTHIFLFKQYK
jgi:hypothetical protein